MKKKVFYLMVLCMGLFSSCDKEEIGFEEPIIPPVEQPEKPSEPENPSVIPSTDDLIRVKIDDDIMAIVGSSDWKSIAYGNGKYVVVGESGYTTTSTDGANWTTPKLAGNANWNGVTYANGKFVIVGSDGYTSTSTDGINWTTPKQSGLVTIWYGIAFGDGKFVMAGYDGDMAYSTDGINWTTLGKLEFITTWYRITYANGKFVMVGNFGYTSTSTDGINWTLRKLITDENGITITNNIFDICTIFN